MIEGHVEHVCVLGHEECALTWRGHCTHPLVDDVTGRVRVLAEDIAAAYEMPVGWAFGLIVDALRPRLWTKEASDE